MEHAKIKEGAKLAELLGEIVVTVWRSSACIAQPSNLSDYSDVVSKNKASHLHENRWRDKLSLIRLCKYKVSHRQYAYWTYFRLGSSSTTVSLRVVRTTNIDGDDFPVGIFRFKYRSRDTLKQLMIIERSPSPETEVGEENNDGPVSVDDLDEAQKMELDKFMRRLKVQYSHFSPNVQHRELEMQPRYSLQYF